MLDPIATKLLKEMLPEVIDPLLNHFNSAANFEFFRQLGISEF